jgi:hypothetical protein
MSRWSQSPWALSVRLSRFALHVANGSVFYVKRHRAFGTNHKNNKGNSMAKNDDKTPDRVEHTKERILLEEADKTIIHKGSETYTGYGWSREQADKSAGEKYSKGQKDK